MEVIKGEFFLCCDELRLHLHRWRQVGVPLGRYMGCTSERPGRLGWAYSYVKPGWAGSAGPCEKCKKGRGKKRLAGPNSISNWVSAHYQIGARKFLFLFKSFYNLQTNLNSIQNLNFDDFYPHSKI
jgi:hypothetical protein